MIAADTSAILHFLHGYDSPARTAVHEFLVSELLVLPPPVVSELLSAIDPEPELESLLLGATQIELLPGYWERAGLTRRRLLSMGLKARLADTLVAQACIDADIVLLSGDTDFRHFSTHCGLKVI